ncbi:MAG: RHS repeat-associated core domain-containing protein [Phycisphaerales bacterium]|nr:RHS repeat-associated core domain-containing protein [Phycisphaerales bacterium]
MHTVGEDPLPDTNHVLQEFFGVRYVDDVCLRRVRLPSGTSGQGPPPNQWVWADPAPADWGYYHLTDAQFSSVAMLPASVKSPVFERVRYDAYGRATHRFAGDLDHDGDIDANDPGWLGHPDYDGPIGSATYEPDHDVNRDGEVDDEWLPTYFEHNGRTGVPDLRISDASTDHPAGPGPDNAYGYCGYVFSGENALYCVRFRWYDPVAGRWLQRDPAGYVDGMSLFLYVMSDPLRMLDPFGLDGDPEGTWRLDMNDHGGPHFQLGDCRYRASDLSPIKHGDKTPPRLSYKDHLRIIDDVGGDKIIRQVPNSALAIALREALGEEVKRRLKNQGVKCLSREEFTKILESTIAQIRKEAAEAAAKETAAKMAKAGAKIGKGVIRKTLPPLLIVYFAEDCVAEGPFAAIYNTVMPIDAELTQMLLKSGQVAWSDYVDNKRLAIMITRYKNSGMTDDDARAAAEADLKKACECASASSNPDD